MDFAHASNGFLFLAVCTGVIGFFFTIFTCMAISDDENYAGLLVVLDIIIVLAFLASGFLGFATR